MNRFTQTLRGSDFKRVAADVGVTPLGPWLVGGCVRRELRRLPQDADYDVGCTGDLMLGATRNRLRKAGYVVVKHTPAFVELNKHGTKVQLLREYGPTLAAVLEAFDFTLCQTGFDGKCFVVGETTLSDIAERRMVVARVTYAADTVRRIQKYVLQGYRMDRTEAVRLLEAVVAKPESVQAVHRYQPEGA